MVQSACEGTYSVTREQSSLTLDIGHWALCAWAGDRRDGFASLFRSGGTMFVFAYVRADVKTPGETSKQMTRSRPPTPAPPGRTMSPFSLLTGKCPPGLSATVTSKVTKSQVTQRGRPAAHCPHRGPEKSVGRLPYNTFTPGAINSGLDNSKGKAYCALTRTAAPRKVSGYRLAHFHAWRDQPRLRRLSSS